VVPYTQSQVSRAAKRVEDWLQAVNGNLPKRRGRRTATVDPRRIEPKPTVPGNGKRRGRKIVDHDDDSRRQPAFFTCIIAPRNIFIALGFNGLRYYALVNRHRRSH
jgi:hypothetical protein